MSATTDGGTFLTEQPVASDRSGTEMAASVPAARVSVVIPTYNSSGRLGEAIESVLAQTYKDLEIVVIDDGSTDDTESVARSFGNRVWYFKQANQGAGAARNAGIKSSRGEYIAFLDADDLWCAEKLDQQIPLLEQDPQLGLVYSDWSVVSDDGVIEDSYLQKVPSASGYVFDELVQRGFILTSGVVVRRACLDDVGDFDNSLSIAQDYDLWLRICYRWKVAVVEKPLVTKRSWHGSLSSNLEKTAIERITLFEKALDNFKNMPYRSRRIVRRQLARNYWDVGYYYFDQFLFQQAREPFLASLRQNWMNGRALGYLAASFLPASAAKSAREFKHTLMSAGRHPRTRSLKASSAPASAPSRRKRVLVISFDFPPNRTSAVYRMVGLTRSLPRLGWQPTVLTIDGGNFALEPRLLEKLPREVEIVRTKLLRINAWEDKTASAMHSIGALHKSGGAESRRTFDRLVRYLGKLMRSTLYFPDDTVGWIPYALSKAMQLHRQQPFDLVYTTAPPRAAPVIGLMLKLLFGIPLVTEFMDPWYAPAGPIRRRSEHWLQGLLFRKSDRVVVMVRQHAEELRRSHRVPPEKLTVVRNGFFEEDFTSLEHTEPNGLDPAYFHLSHFGTIYPGNEGNFFTAMAEMLEEHPELKNKIRLHLIGSPCDEVLRYAKQTVLKEITEFHGFLSQREDVLRMKRTSDCLLLCWGRPDCSRWAVAGKTYDYLRAGRPILAVTAAGGGVDELVQQGQAGWVVQPTDTQAIKGILRHILSEPRKDTANGPPRPEYVAQFRWDHLAERLADVFEEAVGRGS